MGAVLDRIVEEVGVAGLPRSLFIEAPGSLFQVRSLLSLWCLRRARMRHEILQRHTLVRCPQEPGEGCHGAYEKRAVGVVARALHGHEELEPSELRLARVRSLPDGLFHEADERRLVIVEAKMHEADWGQGTAQVLQYVGQARNHSRFFRDELSTVLVVTTDEPTASYRRWESLMRDGRDFDFYVDAACLA